ncbi:hypothetical protein SDC9_198717 [bioreactor metagenome]|uniref:Uncharacterized protein n=1 Tax=bioreactor metagenome TaxID=1076179 RepID=A0A645IJB1_9ZZZZ
MPWGCTGWHDGLLQEIDPGWHAGAFSIRKERENHEEVAFFQGQRLRCAHPPTDDGTKAPYAGLVGARLRAAAAGAF